LSKWNKRETSLLAKEKKKRNISSTIVVVIFDATNYKVHYNTRIAINNSKSTSFLYKPEKSNMV